MKSRLHAGFRKPASAKSQSQVASVLRDQSQGLVPEPVQIAVSLDVGRVGHAIHGEIETQVFPSTQLDQPAPLLWLRPVAESSLTPTVVGNDTVGRRSDMLAAV